MITHEENTWEIEVLKRKFQAEYEIELSYEQAKLINDKEEDAAPAMHFFSVWESSDRELSIMDEILEGHQLKIFTEKKALAIKNFEEGLIEQDKDVTQLLMIEEVLNYYNVKLLPAFFNDYALSLGGFKSEMPKIDYLKATYKNYLDNVKKQLFLNHYRHARTFQPNALKLSLLNHQLGYLFPDYHSFKLSMDEPTKSIKNHLLEKLHYFSYTMDEVVKNILQELKEFRISIAKKYLGESPGWHVELIYSEAEEKEYRLMCLLLLEINKFSR